MASHKNAKKCIRKTERRTLINKSRMSRMRTFLKAFNKLDASATPETLEAAFIKAQSEMAKAKKKGLVHANTLARRVSRMAKHMNALTAAKTAQ